jgi:hypothetical protein
VTGKTNQRKIVVEGRDFESLEAAARAFGMSRNTLDYRLSNGWTPEEACGLRPRPTHSASTPGIPVTVQGHEFKNIKEAAKYYDRSYTYIFDKLKRGCTIEQALGLDKRTDSLQSENAELAVQWHSIKNDPLTAGDVTPNSGKKVWWQCTHGHEWEAVINSRSRGGHGCPYCAGQRPTSDRNFGTEHPELIKEWNWEKNTVRPEEFTPRSKSKVWWKCEKGHSWQATIQNRTRDTKNSCPCCGNRVLCDDNRLAQVRPDIAKDWHPTKNAPLTPHDVVAGGSRKVWWTCKHGHEWQASIGSRVIAGTGCSKCSLQTSRMEIAVYSEINELFNDVVWREKIDGYECDIYLRESNIGIEVDGVYWHSRHPERELAKSAAFEAKGIRLFRLREDGLPLLSDRDVFFKASENEFSVVSKLVRSLMMHGGLDDEQQSKLHAYVDCPGLKNEKLYREIVANLPAPPPGESLAAKQPDIAKQWAYDLNAPLSPEHFRQQANKSVWWRCENGHTWRVSINNRTQHGTGCPLCPRHQSVTVTDDWNLQVFNPALASEWHPMKNGDLRPESVRPKSNQKCWWQCSNGHQWQAVVGSRVAGSGCPYCSGRYPSKENNLAHMYPELLAEWDSEKNKGLDPSEFTPHVNKSIWWCCADGHSWQATIYNRTKNKSGCPTCAQARARKYSIEDFQVLAKARGGTCLSTEFTSSRLKLKFCCKEGHIWEARADAILYSNKWCPICGRRR